MFKLVYICEIYRKNNKKLVRRWDSERELFTTIAGLISISGRAILSVLVRTSPTTWGISSNAKFFPHLYSVSFHLSSVHSQALSYRDHTFGLLVSKLTPTPPTQPEQRLK